jgi:hypothetical protein
VWGASVLHRVLCAGEGLGEIDARRALALEINHLASCDRSERAASTVGRVRIG